VTRGLRTRVTASVLAFLALGATLPVGAAAQSGAAAADTRAIEIIRGAAERYRRTDGVCADFTQHLVTPLLGDERTGEGRVCQARPNRFAMRFTRPDGDRIVVDGSWVWIYYPSLDEKQVVRVPVSAQRGGHDFYREFLEDPESKYEVAYEGEETVGGHPTHRLRLLPKGGASYRVAVLWIDRGTPALRQIRLEEENGNVRTLTLRDIDFASDPNGEWFVFTPPPGAQVIDG